MPAATRQPRVRAAWQRGSRSRPIPIPHARSLVIEQGQQDEATATAGAAAVPRSPLDSPQYTAALQRSIRRHTTTAEEVAAEAGRGGGATQPARLVEALKRLPGTPALAAFQDSLVWVPGQDAVPPSPADEHLARWLAEVPQPGFNADHHVAMEGVADVFVATRGGRTRSGWKPANQDAFAAAAVAPSALLVAVFDGHGRDGDVASAAAARALAGAMPRLLGSRASGGPQEALVRGFQAVGASMALDGTYENCGAAAVAALVEPGRVSAAWAGDCRAVLGLAMGTAAGPQVVVHALTQDHKPDSPLEHDRIAATGRGQVVQLHPGQAHRLCGSTGLTNTLALSRALGDTWAVNLGLTCEPDAVTLSLPAPVAVDLGRGSGCGPSPASALDSLATRSTSSSTDSMEEGSASGSVGARHVLLLASDGLWDMLTHDEAVGLALSSPTAEAAALALVHAAQRRWAAAFAGEFADDLTLAVAFLPA